MLVNLNLLHVTLTQPDIGFTARTKGKYLLPNSPSLLARLRLQQQEYLAARQSLLSLKHQEGLAIDPRLRGYQQQDINFLKQLPHLAIFNQQRTGKTPTLCVLLRERGLSMNLIVAPASTLYKWKEEYEEWNGGPAQVVTGTKAKRQVLYQTYEGTLVISYETLRADVDLLLKYRKIEGMVLDEAHRLRNYKTSQAKACFKLGKQATCRIAMSGTPAYNKADNLYGVLHFLYPSLFTSYWQFIGYYFDMDEQVIRQGGQLRKLQKVGAIRPDRQAELSEFLELISVQRKRTDVMAWLPQKDYEVISLALDKQQRKAYDELVNYWETGEVIVQNQLDRLLRLRQVCVDPALVGVESKSPKTNWIKQFVKDYPDTPVLIVSKFAQYLLSLAKELDGVGLIYGGVPKQTRHKLVQQFQSGELNVLLLQVDACKEGLTLDRAEAMVFVDRYPPIGDIEQIEDRFVSTKQGAYDKPHTVYLLEMEDTIEQYLTEMLNQRKTEAEIINNYEVILNVSNSKSKA